MSWQGRAAIIAVFVFAELSIGDVIPPWVGLPILVVAVVVAWRSIPGLWRILVGGLVGGAIAGLLVMGPGFRVAMRVVALMDPDRTTEFTFAGTVIIVLGVGLVIGATQGVTAHALRRVLNIRSSVVAGSLLGLYFLSQLVFSSGEISDEIFALGAGAWVNIPMFGIFSVAYGIAAMALADRLENWRRRTSSVEPAKVPA